MKMCKTCGLAPASGGSSGRNCLECARIKFRDPTQKRIEAHGLTVNQFNAMKDEQGERCAICGDTPDVLFIDHDHTCCSGSHSCGECVRGLLCRHCNTGLGFFRDNPEALLSAARYLQA